MPMTCGFYIWHGIHQQCRPFAVNSLLTSNALFSFKLDDSR